MITPDGQMSRFAEGLTGVLGLAFDDQNRLYVLETSGPAAGGAPIVPGTGRVVRLTDSGDLEVMATGLVFPTAMRFGSDGMLYVSNYGYRLPAGRRPDREDRHLRRPDALRLTVADGVAPRQFTIGQTRAAASDGVVGKVWDLRGSDYGETVSAPGGARRCGNAEAITP